MLIYILFTFVIAHNIVEAQDKFTTNTILGVDGSFFKNIDKTLFIPYTAQFSIKNAFLTNTLFLNNNNLLPIIEWNSAINRKELTNFSSVIVDPKNKEKYLIINLLETHTTIYFLTFIEKKIKNVVLNIGYHAFPTTILRDTYNAGHSLEIKNFTSAYIILGLLGFSIVYKI